MAATSGHGAVRTTGRRRRRAVAIALGTALVATIGTGVLHPSTSEADQSVCPAGARPITYDVVAFQTVIPVNGWGDKVLDGMMFALRSRQAAILANPNTTQPFVLRADVGDCITITLENQITGRRIGMHPDAIVRYDPKDSDGAHIGNNPDSTVATGQRRTYTWYADRVGQGVISDPANLDTNLPNVSTASLGLYGAVVVHPQGSTWHDTITGAPLLVNGAAVDTQLFADIRGPGPDGRSFVMVVGDELEGVTDKFGAPPTFPTTGIADGTFGLNYRSEPLRNRLRAVLEHRGERRWDPTLGQFVEGAETVVLPDLNVITPTDHFCDGYVAELDRVVDDPGARCTGEEMHLQSWPFGDEGKLVHRAGDEIVVDSDNMIPKAYLGDPITFHVVHPGTTETHPWHQHTQRWLADPDDALSARKDVQSVAPGDSFEIRIEGGAGGLQGTIGDSIFHCHLYPHFAQGFWGHLRILDKRRDGTPLTVVDGQGRAFSGNHYPDGTPIEVLQPLPDRVEPAAPTPTQPGFPLFVFGQSGQRAYRMPYTVVADPYAAVRRPGDTVRGPTALEAASLPALDPAKPGAGFIDPCNGPDGAAANLASPRVYRPHAIDVPLTYNDSGWGSPEGRIYVEESHLAAVRAGTEKPEPYTIRAKLGECMQLYTTNDFHLDDTPPGAAVPTDILGKYDGVYQSASPTTEVSTHVHLVRFDELGTDGTSVGWNYVQAAMLGQTYGYRWFIDQALRTVFFHDHQYPNSQQQRGLFASLNVEPPDATWHDPRTGQPTDGVGTQADIRSPSRADFREFSIYHEDRVPMWTSFTPGRTPDPARAVIAPPAADDYGADQGGMSFNYRNEPFPTRVSPTAPGLQKEPAYVYSSAVHGDPSTPIMRAYSGDPVVIRNVVGSHEEMHTFSVHGHRWLSQPDNPLSTPTDSQSLAIAEWFNYDLVGGRPRFTARPTSTTLRRARADASNGVPIILSAGVNGDGEGGVGLPGDYLYESTALDDTWQGLWGLLRVFRGTVTASTAGAGGALQALPDRAARSTSLSPWAALRPGDRLRPNLLPGLAVCRLTDPIRVYDVVAMQVPIRYNGRGDVDPYGLVYALARDEAAFRAGTKQPEPLFLRANAGDCVNVRLTNKLPATGLPAHTDDVPVQPAAPWPTGTRVTMHPGMVDLDPTRADGSVVGYNFDQSVAPGASALYTWYVPANLAGITANLVDLGDRRGHRHHGLFGGLLIEPKGSTWTDPATGAAIVTGSQAVIRWKDAAGVAQVRREFVADMQDGLRLVDASGAVVTVPAPVDDAYEQGARAVNYRTERFAPRLAVNPDVADVMSSAVHGDPATPVFRAYVGDAVWFRLLVGSDRGRAHSFVLHGHEWRSNAGAPESRLRSSQDGVMPGRAFTYEFANGAGGRQRAPGDYLFRDGLLMGQTNAGLWGLLRVFPAGTPAATTGIRPL